MACQSFVPASPTGRRCQRIWSPTSRWTRDASDGPEEKRRLSETSRANRTIPPEINSILLNGYPEEDRAVTSRLPFHPYHRRHGFTSHTKSPGGPDVARSGSSLGPRRLWLHVLDLGRIRAGAHYGASCAGAL